jgi:hypothetical protein
VGSMSRIWSYRKAFGFEQQCVKNIFKDDHIRQKLNASSIVEIQPTDEAMHKFVENKFIESGEDTSRLLNQVLDGCRDDHLVHIILLPVFAVTFNDVTLANKQLLSFGIEPKIYHTQSEHTNNYNNDAVLRNLVSFFFIIYKNRIIVVIVSVFTLSVVDLGLDSK